MNKALTKAIDHWKYIAPVVAYPTNKKEFELLTSRLDELLDIVGSNEEHPLMGLIDIISHLISTYEKNEGEKLIGSGIDALKFLMKSHHLGQADFPEIASQGVMSEILNGKRVLNLRQVKLLSKRFNVEPATFIDDL